MISRIRTIIFGQAKDPLNPNTQKHIALIAFLAWIGLGADGLSSSCYGPEEAFIALGSHHALGFLLAILSAVTVFLISMAYNQVIALFPNGGGGYRVATQLLGPKAGLISGVALLIDYMMTIAISIASGVDALFSFLPTTWQAHKLAVEVLVLAMLATINLRGAKESIKFLMPIFLGFFLTHVAIILYGIGSHGAGLPKVAHDSLLQTHTLFMSMGGLGFLAFFMRAYSLGAGTYTGIEAVSNNVNILAAPRVKTGRWTMFYMALSLSVVAGGIMLLYLLWHATPTHGMTLNAVVFQTILGHSATAHVSLILVLLLEAGILFVGANTGFLGGPAVLSNMSLDRWVPRRFSFLSSRLVTQNGIIFFALSALVVLLWTKGHVSLLVVLYSINVFITFSMSLFGLCVYWCSHRPKHWPRHFALAAIAFIACFGILIVTVLTKFSLGGWVTLAITLVGVIVCFFIKRYYSRFSALKKKLNQSLYVPIPSNDTPIIPLNPNAQTAIFFVNETGAAMHTLLWAERMFPGVYKNFIFVAHGNVDNGSFGSEKKLTQLQKSTKDNLDYLVKFSQTQGKAATSMIRFGTQPIDDLATMATELQKTYPQSLFFASHYIYPKETWVTRLLHSGLAQILQRRLHRDGIKLLILPLNLT
jgi:amino acid transporter